MKTGIYRHYKGKLYFVLGVARHTETHEELVVYVPLYQHPDGGRALQVRPLSLWESLVDHHGTLSRRFSFVGEEVPPVPKEVAEDAQPN